MIEGTLISKLETNLDSRGFFREIIRFPKDKSLKSSAGQLSHSLVNKGIIKAWHGHVYQAQWNYLVNGSFKVALYDNRKNSKTFGEHHIFEISENKPIIYYFEPGILHGYKCIEGPANIIYCTSGTYDLSDELRIDLDNLTNKIFK